jgi:hypothetical protein
MSVQAMRDATIADAVAAFLIAAGMAAVAGPASAAPAQAPPWSDVSGPVRVQGQRRRGGGLTTRLVLPARWELCAAACCGICATIVRCRRRM